MKTKRTFSDWLLFLSGKEKKVKHRNNEAEDEVILIDNINQSIAKADIEAAKIQQEFQISVLDIMYGTDKHR